VRERRILLGRRRGRAGFRCPDRTRRLRTRSRVCTPSAIASWPAPTGGCLPCARGPGPCCAGWPSRLSRVSGNGGISQVPGQTLARAPRPSTPEEPRCQASSAPRCCRRFSPKHRIPRCGLFRGSIPRPASLAVYASRLDYSSPRKTRSSAGGQPLPGGALTRWVHYRRFRDGYVIGPPSPSFSWRKGRSPPLNES